MVNVLVRWLVPLEAMVVWATEVRFEPGPGLKQNPDGSYSRTLSKEYVESVGGGDNPKEPEGESSAMTNLVVTLVLVGCMVVYANREAVIGSLTMPERPRQKARPSSEAEIAEARAARLARFTGDGPERNQAAFQAVPKSSLYFDTPRLNFVFSDRRVVRSKLIILVETKNF